MEYEVRNPKQVRAIRKKELIIEAGFKLICKNGYYNTNTAQVAKEAGVSTGIVYQYFKDKYDIFMEGLKKYGDDIFFPMIKIEHDNFDISNFDIILKEMIDKYINNHKMSKTAHEEITAMIHSNHDVAKYYYDKELEMTKSIHNTLLKNNFKSKNLSEKVHIMIGMIDNLCHEVVYHQHENMNYNVMSDIVIKNIVDMFKE